MPEVPEIYSYEIVGKKDANTLLVKIDDGREIEVRQLAVIDDNHPAFNTEGMRYKEFPSDFKRLREFAALVADEAPGLYKEMNLLEQQIGELIKNAIRHGNKMDISKKVRVWYDYSNGQARVIVEDEGEGFKDIPLWNKFTLMRTICLVKQDFENLPLFISWRGENASEIDGGNALFAAIEYWNKGFAFNKKGNKVVAIKQFE